MSDHGESLCTHTWKSTFRGQPGGFRRATVRFRYTRQVGLPRGRKHLPGQRREITSSSEPAREPFLTRGRPSVIGRAHRERPQKMTGVPSAAPPTGEGGELRSHLCSYRYCYYLRPPYSGRRPTTPDKTRVWVYYSRIFNTNWILIVVVREIIIKCFFFFSLQQHRVKSFTDQTSPPAIRYCGPDPYLAVRVVLFCIFFFLPVFFSDSERNAESVSLCRIMRSCSLTPPSMAFLCTHFLSFYFSFEQRAFIRPPEIIDDFGTGFVASILWPVHRVWGKKNIKRPYAIKVSETVFFRTQFNRTLINILRPPENSGTPVSGENLSINRFKSVAEFIGCIRPLTRTKPTKKIKSQFTTIRTIEWRIFFSF